MAKKIIKILVNHQAISISVILLFTVLVYSNTFKNDFIVDDYSFIVDWPLIQDLGNLPEFFGPNNQPKGEEGVYSPIKTCFHALNYNLWGLNPFGYHLVALIIHLFGTLLVYRISYQLVLNGSVAFLCGLLFGLHPIHVEAITFLTASIDTLGIVFLFASFYFYIEYQNNNSRGVATYLYSLFFAVLAIFTHELAVVLPLLFLLYDFCLNQNTSPKSKVFLRISPYFIFALIYIGLKSIILGSIARGEYLFGSFYLTMLVIIKALAKYVIILLFPFQLSLNPEISRGIYAVDWQYFDREAVLLQSFFDAQALLSFVLTAVIIYFAVKFWKKKPLHSFCVGWFYISLLPVLNIIPSESYFAERYLYPGSFGFCLGLAIFLNSLYHNKGSKLLKLSGKWLSIGIISVILVFYSARTVMRNFDWHDELTFYQAEAHVNPDHPIIQRDLGAIYLQNRRLTEALKHLQKAIALRPSDEDAHFALAEVYTKLEDLPKARKSYLKAIDINSDFAEAYYNLGRIHARLGEMNMARKSLAKAIRLFQRQRNFLKANLARKVYRARFGSGE